MNSSHCKYSRTFKTLRKHVFDRNSRSCILSSLDLDEDKNSNTFHTSRLPYSSPTNHTTFNKIVINYPGTVAIDSIINYRTGQGKNGRNENKWRKQREGIYSPPAVNPGNKRCGMVILEADDSSSGESENEEVDDESGHE
ncbi:unnamed protein product [Lymnaea stagnalis]|uniref:Uncharacterized protein n=1 Tax=Lymnaea stagnalis TaxID=6523 RepID=A0AAV2I3M1_LYMST